MWAHRGRRAVFALSLLGAACGSAPAAAPERPSADVLAARAQCSFESGDTERGLELATRALVVRIARYGIEHPEPARSFLQLGDMRRALGRLGWAKQSYRRGLELLAAHRNSNVDSPSAAETAALERTLRARLSLLREQD